MTMVGCQRQSRASHPDKIKHIPWMGPVKVGEREMIAFRQVKSTGKGIESQATVVMASGRWTEMLITVTSKGYVNDHRRRDHRCYCAGVEGRSSSSSCWSGGVIAIVIHRHRHARVEEGSLWP